MIPISKEVMTIAGREATLVSNEPLAGVNEVMTVSDQVRSQIDNNLLNTRV